MYDGNLLLSSQHIYLDGDSHQLRSLFQIILLQRTIIVRLLVATLQVGMTRKQDGGYTQSTQLKWDYLHLVKISLTH